MKNKYILIIAGEPYSIFSEIFFKTLKKKKIKIMKNHIILIGKNEILFKNNKKIQDIP